VIQTLAQQIQDGGRAPYWKSNKSPYLRNDWTDRAAKFDKVMHFDHLNPIRR